MIMYVQFQQDGYSEILDFIGLNYDIYTINLIKTHGSESRGQVKQNAWPLPWVIKVERATTTWVIYEIQAKLFKNHRTL